MLFRSEESDIDDEEEPPTYDTDATTAGTHDPATAVYTAGHTPSPPPEAAVVNGVAHDSPAAASPPESFSVAGSTPPARHTTLSHSYRLPATASPDPVPIPPRIDSPVRTSIIGTPVPRPTNPFYREPFSISAIPLPSGTVSVRADSISPAVERASASSPRGTTETARPHSRVPDPPFSLDEWLASLEEQGRYDSDVHVLADF